MNVHAVIPARGGSKGIPRKNLARVGGRSLLEYTCAAAVGSSLVGRTVVSTDDEEIAAVARSLGVEVVQRPAELATDEASMAAVLAHAVGWFREVGDVPDAVVLLQPTSPLRRAEHVDGAIALLERSGAAAVVSVVAVPHQYNPLSVLVREDGDRLRPYVDGGDRVTRRQDKPVVFARNGPAVFVVRTGEVRADRVYPDDIAGYEMAAIDSFDVDSPDDLRIVELLLSAGR